MITSPSLVMNAANSWMPPTLSTVQVTMHIRYPPSRVYMLMSSTLAAPPTEFSGRYQARIEFASMKYRRPLKLLTLASVLVVTPVMLIGDDAPVTDCQVVPLY